MSEDPKPKTMSNLTKKELYDKCKDYIKIEEEFKKYKEQVATYEQQLEVRGNYIQQLQKERDDLLNNAIDKVPLSLGELLSQQKEKLTKEKEKTDKETTHYVIIGTPSINIEKNSQIGLSFQNKRLFSVNCKSLLDGHTYELSDLNSDGKFDIISFFQKPEGIMIEGFIIKDGRLEPIDRALIDGRNEGNAEAMEKLKKLTQN